MIDIKETGTRLKQYRITEGYSQRGLADLLGYTPNAISKWETGKGLPSLEIVMILADLYNVYVEDLIIMEAER